MPLFLYPVSNDRLMIAEVQILGQFFIYIKRGKLFFKSHLYGLNIPRQHIKVCILKGSMSCLVYQNNFSPSRNHKQVLTCQWIKVARCETQWASSYARTCFQLQAISLWDTGMGAVIVTRQTPPSSKLRKFTRPQFPHQHNDESVISS